MGFRVQITSIETIKPAAPTPAHLKSHTLSLIDQLFTLAYAPQVLFYHNNIPDPKTPSRLKHSLSKTLSLYYPLAGRLTTDVCSVDCNDQGVYFAEARAEFSLGSFLSSPNRLESIKAFLPPGTSYDQGANTNTSNTNNDNKPVSTIATELIPLKVQLTTFNCGSVALGCQWLHKILDGFSWGNFLKSWSAFATDREDRDVITPDFALARSLFPPSSSIVLPATAVRGPVPLGPDLQVDHWCIIRPFRFTPKAIAALQAKARSDCVPNPTRVETLTGFIWKHAMAAATRVGEESNCDLPGHSVVIHAVNIRPCTSPALPPAAIGNIFMDLIIATSEFGNPAIDLSNMVAAVHKGLSETKDVEFISKFQGEEGAEVVCNYQQKMRGLRSDNNVRTYRFTSWGSHNLNADFGFGSPIWVGFYSDRRPSFQGNLAPLIETPGQGIDAWLILDEREMAVLLSDHEFLEFASPTF